MIRLENLSLRYGDGPKVLSDVNCYLPTGSMHFLTGVSGAGKTSLMRILHLALRPTSGRLHLMGRDVGVQSRDALAQIRQKTGVVFQDFRLLDHLSIYDNVALPLRVSGQQVPKLGRANNKVTELLRWVGLGNHMDSQPATLSGGQKQRAAIARAIINRPRLLLADEPTGNVDDDMSIRLLRLFEELNRLGTTVVVATHSQLLLRRFDYPILELGDGTLRPMTSVQLPASARAGAEGVQP